MSSVYYSEDDDESDSSDQRYTGRLMSSVMNGGNHSSR